MSKAKDNFEFAFKTDIPFGKSPIPDLFNTFFTYSSPLLEKRVIESQKIMDKFKERIPIIIERSTTEQKLPDLDQQKYRPIKSLISSSIDT